MLSHTSTLSERYEILGEIGRGTMGVVHEARDTKIDRIVAIKTILMVGLAPADEQEYRQRFLDEARTAGRLSHPGIVTIFDVDAALGAASPYFVMEYVEGKSLSKLLDDNDGKLPLDPALRIAQEIAEALHYAHSQKVIHRDIKPENILITPEGHAKIADFGIARLDRGHLTVVGRMLGSPAYMAPEQLEGGNIDARSDIFSLGVVLYTMLTGHRPFQGNSTATVCFKLANRDPLPVSSWNLGYPMELDEVVARAMAKDPAARFQSGMEMAKELENLRQSHKLMPQPLSGIMRIIGQEEEQSSVMDSIPEDEPTSVTAPAAHSLPVATVADHPVREEPRAVVPVRLTSQISQDSPNVLKLSKSALSKYVLSAAALVVAIVGFSAWGRKKHSPANESGPLVTVKTSEARNNAAPASPSGEQDHTKKRHDDIKSLPIQKMDSASKNMKPRSHSGSVSLAREGDRTADSAAENVDDASAQEPLSVNMVHLSDLNVSIEHSFQNAHASIFVDKRLVYDEDLHGEKKRRALIFSHTKGRQSGTITVIPGKHEIAVRVQSPKDGYDVSQNLAKSFAPVSNTVLFIKCDKGNNKLQLVVQ